ncbi:MAG: hypothetical protein JXR68_03795 [Bacteroidales bacterium]|nr:hypothetical protein [Bacteroidales bacterium]
MTKKDFFILLIKLFGLFSAITTIFSALPGSLAYAISDIDIFSVIGIILIVLAVLGLFILLIFKSDKVVKILKLDKGFDDDRIELAQFSSQDIIKIGSFIIGGILLLKNIPTFLSYALISFKEDIGMLAYVHRDTFLWVLSGINIVIGYFLLTNYNIVSKLFEGKKKKE